MNKSGDIFLFVSAFFFGECVFFVIHYVCVYFFVGLLRWICIENFLLFRHTYFTQVSFWCIFSMYCWEVYINVLRYFSLHKAGIYIGFYRKYWTWKIMMCLFFIFFLCQYLGCVFTSFRFSRMVSSPCRYFSSYQYNFLFRFSYF